MMPDLRVAAWMDAARVRRWSVVCLVAQLVIGVGIAAGTHGWIVRLPAASTTDFVSFYAAGKVVASGPAERVYDRAVHGAAEKAATEPGIGYVYFFYPPVYLLYCRVLATMPYLAAFFCFETLGVALCGVALRGILGTCPAWWWLPLLSFSPALWNFGFGQNAFMTAGFFGLGTMLLQRRRDFAGGLVLGLLAFKPHTGLLLPVALLAAANWRAVGGATASVLGSVVLSGMVFGWDCWRKFVMVMLHSPAEFASGSVTPLSLTINMLGAARAHGAGPGLAWGLQAAVQVGVAAAVVLCWRRGADDARRGARYAVLIGGSLLVMPIVLFYDLTALAMAAAWIVRDARRTGFLAFEKAVLGGAWLGGLLCYPFARGLHVPLGLACVAAVFTVAVRRNLSGAYPAVNHSDGIVDTASSAFGRARPVGMAK